MHESDGSNLPSLPNRSHLSRWKKISSKHSPSTHRCRIILGSATPDKKISPISLSQRQQAMVIVDETSEPESPTHDGIVRCISGVCVRALRSISSSMVRGASGRLRSRTRLGRSQGLHALQSFASDYPECEPVPLYSGTERLRIDGI